MLIKRYFVTTYESAQFIKNNSNKALKFIIDTVVLFLTLFVIYMSIYTVFAVFG